MQIPFVIDNEHTTAAAALNSLLAASEGCPLDIATAYFSVSGYRLIKEGLHRLGALRLLLGAEPATGADIGLRPDPKAMLAQMRGELEAQPFKEETLRLVEDFIAFLRMDKARCAFPRRLPARQGVHLPSGPRRPQQPRRPPAAVRGNRGVQQLHRAGFGAEQRTEPRPSRVRRHRRGHGPSGRPAGGIPSRQSAGRPRFD